MKRKNNKKNSLNPLEPFRFVSSGRSREVSGNVHLRGDNGTGSRETEQDHADMQVSGVQEGPHGTPGSDWVPQELLSTILHLL